MHCLRVTLSSSGGESAVAKFSGRPASRVRAAAVSRSFSDAVLFAFREKKGLDQSGLCTVVIKFKQEARSPGRIAAGVGEGDAADRGRRAADEVLGRI